jgi:predicted TIM-barrel fold metal-dependent hydrolase
VKFELSEGAGFCGWYPDLRLDSPLFMRIWARAESLGLAVAIDPSHIGSKGYQVEELEKVVPAFPRLNFVICHLGFPYPGIEKNADDLARWERMLRLAGYGNVWFDISALSVFFRDEGYPFASAAAIVSKFTAHYGADKAVWGSDIPGALVFATYRQLLDMLTKSGRFAGSDLDRLLGVNARDAYRLDR